MSTESIRMNCAFCGRPFSLEYRPEPTWPYDTKMYACPYPNCRKDVAHLIAFAGELIDFWPGHGAEPRQRSSVH